MKSRRRLDPSLVAFPRRHVLKGTVAMGALMQARGGVAATGNAAPRFHVHADGSFDLSFGPLVLSRAYPALDDVPLHPMSVRVQASADATKIVYELEHGKVSLTLGTEPQRVWIDMVVEGMAEAPHWAYPLAGARVHGANRFFKQGVGFGGPSGVFPIPEAGNNHAPNRLTEAAWSYDSFMTTAVIASTDEVLLTGAVAHRDFFQRSTVYNKSHRRELVEKKPALDDVILEAGFSTERIPLPDGRLVLPRLYVRADRSLPSALDGWALHLAEANQIKLKSPPRLHWDSWYEFYESHDSARLKDTLAGMLKTTPRVPFAGVLIDAGFSPAGDWLIADERLYEGGLQKTFAAISEAGFAPGIWISPFMVSSLSQVYRQHPEWMLHDPQGKPILHGKGKPFFNIYATHEERYYLDTTHPGAFAFLRDTFRTYRKWGVKSYKLDFMEWGFKDSTLVRRHQTGKSSTQNFVAVLKMIKEEIGPDAYFHGCITPFAPMLGFADGMRVGYDVDTDTWKKDGNTVNMFQETVASQYMNNVLWQNDPDVFYVRDGTGTTKLTDDEAVALTLWNGILGGVVSTSDRPHRLSADRLALLRFVVPGKRFGKARFPLWGKARATNVFPGLVAVRDYPWLKAHAVLVVNQGEDPISTKLSLAALGISLQSHVFAWRPGSSKRVGAATDFNVELKPHQCLLFFISGTNTPPPTDLGLSGEPVAGLGKP